MEPTPVDNIELQKLNSKKDDKSESIDVQNNEIEKKVSLSSSNNGNTPLIIPTSNYNGNQSENDRLKSDARPVSA